MGLTLQEGLVKALKKLEDSSFQGFIEKLSVLEVREQYKNIPKDELTGKDPEHVAGLIIEYYKYAYGAEVTLVVLEDIDEKKVREELQHDLMEADPSKNGLGTKMFTVMRNDFLFDDKVNFIDDHRSKLITKITDVDPVLRDLRDQGLLTQEQYNDVMENITTWEKMRDLCDIIRYWEDIGKYTAYNVLRGYNEEIIRDLETEDWNLVLRLESQTGGGHFLDRHRSHLIDNIKEVNPLLEDLRSNCLLTEGNYNDLQAMTTPEIKMRNLCDIFRHQSDTVKDQVYIYLWRYNYTVINNLEISERKAKST
ncbi:apoptosis-associated speck-like protein containing a CARD [Rhinoderma darwinii]|uniref:apoptosis-associated speck-like protein containing a CARD n=1 Tax=Rhinoderma darwinii TaxID=43563 RepID=UPI003F6699DA